MSDAPPVTIVVPVRNEADRIAAFVAAHRWAQEIIVVDNGSSDNTAELAARAGARVVDRPDVTTGEARNQGAVLAMHDWILTLDADEVMEGDVAHELSSVLAAPAAAAYRFRLRNIVMGREQRHGPLAPSWAIRLYRRTQRWTGPLIHEDLQLDGPVGTLRSTIRHTPYRNLDDHLSRLDRYARLGARQMHDRGRRATVFDRYGRPAWRFFRAWILKAGLLGGRTGFALCRLDARSAFLKYRYLHQLERGMEVQ